MSGAPGADGQHEATESAVGTRPGTGRPQASRAWLAALVRRSGVGARSVERLGARLARGGEGELAGEVAPRWSLARPRIGGRE